MYTCALAPIKKGDRVLFLTQKVRGRGYEYTIGVVYGVYGERYVEVKGVDGVREVVYVDDVKGVYPSPLLPPSCPSCPSCPS